MTSKRGDPAGPEDVEIAVRAFRRFAQEHPEHAEWIKSGAPSIRSQDDHIRIFGYPYGGTPRKQKGAGTTGPPKRRSRREK